MRRSFVIAVVIAVFGISASAAQAEPTAPIIVGAWPAGVGTETANLRAEIDPGELPTTYLFEYTTEANFRAKGFIGATKFPQTGVGIGTGLVLQHIGGLLPQTAYRFRAVATNNEGVTAGKTRSFETDEPEPIFSLPDNRGWEMVSPVDKNGGEIQGVGENHGGGILQAAAAGGAVTYTSASSFANPLGSPGPNQYLSTRGSGPTWSTENITLPMLAGTYPESLTSGVPYQLFSSDLSASLVSNGRRCRTSVVTQCPVENAPLTGSGAPAGYRNYYLRKGAGSYKGLISSAPAMAAEHFELGFVAATPKLDHIVLSSCAALTSDATEVPGTEGECDPAEQNLYEWSGGTLTLINKLPGESVGTPGAVLSAQSGAISTDGSRIYFTNVKTGGIYLYEAGAETRHLPETVSVGATFQTATATGSLAFFTKGGHLFRYSASEEESTDLTTETEVLGVLGVSNDGTYIYYLTPTGLVLNRNGAITPIAPQASLSNTPPTTGTARVSADGRHLLFVSTSELALYDNRNAKDNTPEPEVYLFTAPGTAGAGIACASCNPSGERPIGPAELPGASPNGEGQFAAQAYKPRVLSADSKRVFFESFDSLAVSDTNGDRDVYEWDAPGVGGCAKPVGCVNLISSGRSEGGASFLDASETGSDAFFLTDGSLVNTDTSGVDVYDARVDGGAPSGSQLIPCFGDACQPLPPTPENPSLGSIRSKKSGNEEEVKSRQLKCKKNQIKKLGRCVPKPKKKKHHKGKK